MPQTTEHLLQRLPDQLTSHGAQHPVADLLGARAQAWQPRRPTAMKRKAGGVLHLWRVLLAAAAPTGTRASAKTSPAAQGIFRAGNRQSAAKKHKSSPWAGGLRPKSFFVVWCSVNLHLWGEKAQKLIPREKGRVLVMSEVSNLGTPAELKNA